MGLSVEHQRRRLLLAALLGLCLGLGPGLLQPFCQPCLHFVKRDVSVTISVEFLHEVCNVLPEASVVLVAAVRVQQHFGHLAQLISIDRPGLVLIKFVEEGAERIFAYVAVLVHENAARVFRQTRHHGSGFDPHKLLVRRLLFALLQLWVHDLIHTVGR